jgi:hypothetical protein
MPFPELSKSRILLTIDPLPIAAADVAILRADSSIELVECAIAASVEKAKSVFCLTERDHRLSPERWKMFRD